ncbi:hypothetical protein GGE68_000453 [Rhizobium leguminosarum]|nr:hypothetical protein [Rhizobium leguminosarum]
MWLHIAMTGDDIPAKIEIFTAAAGRLSRALPRP